LVEGPQCAPPKQEAQEAPKPAPSPAVFVPSPLSRSIVTVADTKTADTAAAKGIEPETGAPQGAQNIQCKNPETLEEIAKINEGSIAQPTYTVQDGKVGPKTYSGWIRFSLNCERCHGPGGVGSAIAPNLAEAIKGLNYRQFQTILTCGLVGNIGAGVMPSWKDNPNVMPYVSNLYAYLKARADGGLQAGRPERIASSKQ
jgi:mono/diheme cytochrome c family protein